MGTKEIYQQQMQAKLDEWNAEIAKLEAKARQASAESQLEFEKQKSLLEANMKVVSENLEKLTDAGESAWAEMKQGIDKAFVEVSSSFYAAAEKFKK